MTWLTCVRALSLGLALLGAQGAAAEDYYSGKKIFIVSASSAGGGYDQYARLLARHLGKRIPGAPTIIVQNMPGAEAANENAPIYMLDAVAIQALLKKAYGAQQDQIRQLRSLALAKSN